MRSEAEKKTVIDYRRELLPLSQTFIKEQILAYRHWRGVLLGCPIRELPLDGLEMLSLGPARPSRLIRLLRKVYLRLAGDAPRDNNDILAQTPTSVIEKLKREGASLFHAHFGMDGVAAWPLAQALGLPMLVSLYGYDINIYREWWEGGHGGQHMREYPAQLLALATEPRVHFIAISEALRDQAIRFGIPAQKISTQYLGIDKQKFAAAGPPICERQKRVLFVGRLVEKKGCAYLIEAMARVTKIVPDAQLVVIGDGPQRRELKALARRLSVRVVFLGAQPAHEVKKALDATRVFCLPSITAKNGDAEGLPVSIVEAQASGVPVVTSARGGASEGIEDGKTGFAFPEGDIVTLANTLALLLQDDAVAQAFALRAPRFVAESHDIRVCTDGLERLYDAWARGGSVHSTPMAK